ncbi:MAG: radical SAM protein [Gemmatimonadota bacterium]|nr:radical SAM protein [Gemmatimonadota bacterium]
MKVAISYPPIVNERGQVAMVSQNRNVQYFKDPTYLLPVVHAQAATWLKATGVEVYWDDGNSQGKSFDKWYQDLLAAKPDIVVFESTTPVMKFYWKLIDKLKGDLPGTIVVMTGFHSMRKPEETLESSRTDIVLLSNHVDFVLQRLVPYIAEHDNWRVSCDIEGLWIRLEDDSFRNTGDFKQVESLDQSPDLDRDLVQWKNYAYENGNFLQTPGTYATSVIRDCMFGKCTFCRYNGPGLSFSIRSVEKSLDEYQHLIEDYKVREIFDDSGVWYRGRQARQFARGIIDRGLHKKGVYFGINTRFAYLDEETIELLGKANFRFILVGLEACDEFTLRKLNKGYLPRHIIPNLEWYTKYGLHPHLTIMIGYYWQTREMLDQTVDMVREIMFKGLARTLQVTLCTPLDFTPYHQECIDQGVLLTDDYNDFDMSRMIVKTPLAHEEYYKAIREMYGVAVDPRFLWRQMRFLATLDRRNWQFLFTYGWRALRRVRQHVYNLTRAGTDGVNGGEQIGR